MSIESRVSRRRVLKLTRDATLATAASRLLGIWPTPALAVEPMTVMAIVAAGIKVISAFSKKGDGGLGATMRALNEKLDLVVSQIAEVQVALGEIQVAIAELPRRFEEIVDASWTRYRVEEVRGAVDQWSEIFRGQESYAISRSDYRRADLEHVRRRVWDARSALSASDRGEDPLGAAIAPIALALEVNAHTVLNGVSPGLKSLLVAYFEWLDKILDPRRSRSTAKAVLDLTTARDDRLKQIAESDLGKRSGFSISARNSSTIGQSVGCVQEYAPRSTYQRRNMHWQSMNGAPYELEVVPEKLGRQSRYLFVWRFEVSESRSGTPLIQLKQESGTSLPTWVDKTVAPCSYERVSFMQTPTQLYEAARHRSDPQRILGEVVRAQQVLDELNEFEVRLAYAIAAQEAAQSARQKVIELRQELGG